MKNLPLLGSGYRPSAWCPNCAAPYPSHLTHCPECQVEQTRPDWVQAIEVLLARWAARARYRAACAEGGPE